MFFSKLFKNRKGNKENISIGIFNIAVVLNIFSLSSSLLLLFSCFFASKTKINILICSSVMILAGCYVAEVFLAWASAILNNNETPKKKK